MIKEISEVTFVKKNSFSNFYFFQIEIADTKNLLKFSNNNHEDSVDNKVIIVNDQLVLEFLDNLFRVVDSWEEKYMAENNLDATEWYLTISYKNGCKERFYGKDLYPNNFDSLEKIKDKLIKNATEISV